MKWKSVCMGRQCHATNRFAFSLVEVVFALGISSFAIISIIALMPIGLQSSRTSIEESAALNILSAVVADRRATPFTNASAIYQLPALSSTMTMVTGTFGIADDNQELVALGKARYRITYKFTPPTPTTLNPFIGHFRASWPAVNANSLDSVEMVVTFPQP